jgi:hypothetical protein
MPAVWQNPTGVVRSVQPERRPVTHFDHGFETGSGNTTDLAARWRSQVAAYAGTSIKRTSHKDG